MFRKNTFLIVCLLMVVIGCSPTEPLVGEIEYSDVVGTKWYKIEELSEMSKAVDVFKFGRDSIFYSVSKYHDNLGDGPYSVRYFKGYVNNFRYVIDPDGDTILQFNWTRKEYNGGFDGAQVTDYSTSSQWFLWKIEGGILFFGTVDADDGESWYWEFERL